MPGVGGCFSQRSDGGGRASGPCVAGIGGRGGGCRTPCVALHRKGGAADAGARATGAGRRSGGRSVAYGGRAPAGPRPLRVPPSQRESAAKATR